MLREINQIEDLAPLRADWQRLLSVTPGASFFHTLDWLECYWRHFAADQRLRVLVVDDETTSRPSGILPLVVRRDQTGVGTLRMLTYPLHGWGSFYGPIGPDAPGTLSAGLSHVKQTKRDWDVLELRWLGAPETDVAAAADAMREAGFQAYLSRANRTALVEFDGTWDDYLAGRPRAWRRNLRAAGRKLAADGSFEYVRYRPRGQECGDSDPRWDLYEACEGLAERSWQARAFRGTTLSHSIVRPFLREVHTAAAALGAVDVNLLFVAGRPAAFMYGYYWRGAVYGLRSGFDPQYAGDSVGNVLLAEAIRDGFVRGDRLFDLGVGSLETKRHVQTRLAEIYRLSHYRATALRAQLLRVRRWWAHRERSPAK